MALCEDCKPMAVAKGIKKCDCFVCGQQMWTGVLDSAHICPTCSDKTGVCQRCHRDVGEMTLEEFTEATKGLNKEKVNTTFTPFLLKGVLSQ